MEILLLILKIIWIVLLAVLALIFFTIILVLFVPVRYRLNAEYFDNDPDVNVRVSWLLHILHISLRITKEHKCCIIRIFGIKIMDIFHPKSKKKKQIRNASHSKEEDIDSPKTKESDINETNSAKETDPDFAAEDKKGIFDKISEFIFKLTESISSIPKRIHAAKETGTNLRIQAEKWITVLKRDKTKHAIECAKDLLIWLLKRLLPKKWSAYARFGFKDPSTTAQILGYYWMFIGIFANHVICLPEFEKEIMEGKINIQGHIRVCTFLRVGWKILFDPNLKYLRKIKAEVDSV